MTNTTAVATESTTAAPAAGTESPARRRPARRTNDAWRWMTAGVILVLAIGTQLVVDLTSTSGLNTSDFTGHYWLQLVLIASGLVLLVCGIVKSRRH